MPLPSIRDDVNFLACSCVEIVIFVWNSIPFNNPIRSILDSNHFSINVVAIEKNKFPFFIPAVTYLPSYRHFWYTFIAGMMQRRPRLLRRRFQFECRDRWWSTNNNRRTIFCYPRIHVYDIWILWLRLLSIWSFTRRLGSPFPFLPICQSQEQSLNINNQSLILRHWVYSV